MEEQNNLKTLINHLKSVEIKDEGWSNVVKGFTEESFNTSPSDCTHKRQRGSDTGISCIDCHTVILGFGVDGQSSFCLKHEFWWLPMKKTPQLMLLVSIVEHLGQYLPR